MIFEEIMDYERTHNVYGASCAAATNSLGSEAMMVDGHMANGGGSGSGSGGDGSATASASASATGAGHQS